LLGHVADHEENTPGTFFCFKNVQYLRVTSESGRRQKETGDFFICGADLVNVERERR